ncbi:MFS transporter [Streptacidiphilus sp. 4-A2]|nr:MFS transporter [Streptacidiphilus sp. 4-A2]
MPTVGGTRTTRRIQFLAPLAHRDFRILWLGMSTSLLGDGVLLVALAWQVYTLTGSPSGMSVVGVALAVPQLALVLLGGVVGDRLDRRSLLIGSDLVRGACLTVLAVLAFTGDIRLWHLVVVAAVYGAPPGSSRRPSRRSCPVWCPLTSWSRPTPWTSSSVPRPSRSAGPPSAACSSASPGPRAPSPSTR